MPNKAIRGQRKLNGASTTVTGNGLEISNNGTHTIVRDGNNCEKAFNGTLRSIEQVDGKTRINGMTFNCTTPPSTPSITSSAHHRTGGNPNLALWLVLGATVINSLGALGGRSSRKKKPANSDGKWVEKTRTLAGTSKNASNAIG